MPRPSARNRVIAAAQEVFAEEGFVGATTKAIAGRAGIAEGTLFRHFPDKRALLAAVLGPFARDVVAPEVTRQVLALLERDHDSLEAFLAAVVDDRLDLLARHPTWFRVLLQEALLQPELRRVLEEHVAAVLVPPFERACETLQSRGLMAAIPPRRALRLMSSVVGGFGLFRHILAPDGPWDDEAERREMLRFLARGFAP